LQRTPDLSRVTHVVGEALDGLDKTPEAIAEFEAAAKADSHAPNVNFGLGFSIGKLRRYEQAAPSV